MSEAVRVAVVGAGSMGANHARVYSNLKGIELVGVYDTEIDRARSLAEQHGVEVFDTVAAVAAAVDAASVAVSSSAHLDMGLALLDNGVHILMEKPLATTAADARQLVAAADEAGLILTVGHIEQFNPAVEQLSRILAAGDAPVAFDAHRMSAVSARVVDVDVVADLMIHDLEIVLSLARSELVDVTARGVRGGPAGSLCYVTALLTFADGSVATLTASRVTQNKVRQLHVTTPERFYAVDYSAQELQIYRQGRVGDLSGGDTFTDGQYVLDVGTERVFVRQTEPLAAELAHFADCVRGDDTIRVTGERAARAVELAALVTEAAEGAVP
jgi:predicted dehydrogenase